jgi:hypothetical protein
MEKNTWRRIHSASGAQPSIHQVQGHLCVCTVGGRNMSQLLIWIFRDYGTNEWTLKHTISTLNVFGKSDIQFGFLDCDVDYTMIAVHLEWNMIFFVGKEPLLHMTWTVEKFMSSLPLSLGIVDVGS